MDSYCIDKGLLLDKPYLVTLEAPGEHSLHRYVTVDGGTTHFAPAQSSSTSNQTLLLFILQPLGRIGLPRKQFQYSEGARGHRALLDRVSD
jgi:hypothetical protein